MLGKTLAGYGIHNCKSHDFGLFCLSEIPFAAAFCMHRYENPLEIFGGATLSLWAEEFKNFEKAIDFEKRK